MACPHGKLWFYSTRGVHGCFSNFSSHPVVIDGRRYATTEHYFQAMKFVGSPVDMEAVADAPSPKLAAQMGRDRKRPLRKDWELVKDDVMRTALEAKFSQHASCRETLLGTQGLFLVEHTANDKYWADGGDQEWDLSTPERNIGRNMLGILLTELRDRIQAEGAGAPATASSA
eukprot:TRINITY_DN13451_c0_g1_i1.p1 TRINITY_DN13451_c0_g1~~TRINITY_DN13451_c0_g1_i1.p1  ORF type:complete len:186 (+),score=42.78 TRINITY_DN13451_c0_g1_i1:40-558(+)